MQIYNAIFKAYQEYFCSEKSLICSLSTLIHKIEEVCNQTKI